jgi:hypothetical protein
MPFLTDRLDPNSNPDATAEIYHQKTYSYKYFDYVARKLSIRNKTTHPYEFGSGRKNF